MDAKLVAEAETLRRTTERLERVGLIVDVAALSRQQRRAAFALQRLLVDGAEEPEPQRPPIGFAYPNAR